MPLVKSGSKAAMSANIKAEMKAGKPQRQAVAIAYSVARKSGKGDAAYSQKPTMPVHSPTGGFDAGTSPAHSPGGTPSPSVGAADGDVNYGRTMTGGTWKRGACID